MKYFIRIEKMGWSNGVEVVKANFPLVLEADGFDSDGDWNILGPYLSLRGGYWKIRRTHYGLSLTLYDRKDSTWDAIVGHDLPTILAMLDVPHVPLVVGDHGTGDVFIEGAGMLSPGQFNWTLAASQA